MISAYVRNLNRLLESERPASQPLSLHDRFLNWYRSMPSFTRSRPFSMSEFEAALKTQGRYNPAMAGGLGLRGGEQTPLTFIEMRQHRRLALHERIFVYHPVSYDAARSP